MNTIYINYVFIILITITIRMEAFGQGFVNLNFESTSLFPNGSASEVSTIIGLPGWTAFIGGTSQSTILYNNGTLGNSCLAILGGVNSVNPVIEGNFSAMLVAGASPGNSSVSADAALSQTGLVPANAVSAFFKAYSQGNGPASLWVTLNGQSVSIVPLATTAHYTLYGGDISSLQDKQPLSHLPLVVTFRKDLKYLGWIRSHSRQLLCPNRAHLRWPAWGWERWAGNAGGVADLSKMIEWAPHRGQNK